MSPRHRFAIILSLSVLAGIVDSPARAESDLARAYRVIVGKQFVDLTHSFDSTTPVWSGFGQAKMPPAADPSRIAGIVPTKGSGTEVTLSFADWAGEARDQMIVKLYTGCYSMEVRELRPGRIVGRIWRRAFGSAHAGVATAA